MYRLLFPFRRFLALLICLTGLAQAHPMPSSVVLLDVQNTVVQAEVQIPLSELGLAMQENLLGSPAQVLAAHETEFTRYLIQHVRPLAPGGQTWTVAVGALKVSGAEQTATGPYQELVARLTLTPPAGVDARTFTFAYDAVVHQVVTHRVLVSVRQDWAHGISPELGVAQLGVIRLDPVDNTIAPIQVDRSGGTLWTGFLGMLRLGVNHIATGTDHLLFLLTLLLPAPLLVVAGRRGTAQWGPFAGWRRSLRHILGIITAFTLGHSATLILGTVMNLQIPDKPIEVLIALTILISAVHALWPLFPGREVLVAGGFGLIHGMAFSFTLSELHLNGSQMALSLLGFNLGIEAMQLLVMALTLPWLVLLARTEVYRPVRIVGASVAALAAVGWLGQRLGVQNPLGDLADRLGGVGPWVVLGLAILAMLVTAENYFRMRRTRLSVR